MPGVTVTRTFLDSLFSVGWRPLRVTPVHGGKSRAVGMDQLGWSYPISGVPALRAAPGTQSRTSPRLEQAQRRSFRRGCLQTNIAPGQTEIVQLPPHRSRPPASHNCTPQSRRMCGRMRDSALGGAGSARMVSGAILEPTDQWPGRSLSATWTSWGLVSPGGANGGGVFAPGGGTHIVRTFRIGKRCSAGGRNSPRYCVM
jgi:hypothetical protein